MFQIRTRPGQGGRATLLAVTAALLTTALASAPTAAADVPKPSGYRLQHSVGNFSNTTEFAVEFRLAAPRLLRAERLDLAIGTLSDGARLQPFLSLGPVWRRNLGLRGFLDFGFSPTLLAGSRIDDDNLGGSLHFSSSLAIGRRFGDYGEYTIALRAQHLSNGGLNSTNPGLDVVGLSIARDFAN